jgi:cardiolipin synthase
MSWVWIPFIIWAIDLIIKIVAIGAIPTNRRPSSSIAWLLFIFILPVLGLIIFLLIGSPNVRGRRAKVQDGATLAIADRMAGQPVLPPSAPLSSGVDTLVALNAKLTALPCVLGVTHGLIGDAEENSRAMAAVIDTAQHTVHVEYFIMAWDDTTEPVFAALARAVQRGVKVRVLYDHVATRSIPGYAEMKSRFTAAGFEWYPMMPIQPLKGNWRRPDLRNHRKLLVVDSTVGFMGSQNLITPSYLKPKNIKAGRAWKDLNIKLTGEIVTSLELVFATDWFSETGERLNKMLALEPPGGHERLGDPMQLIPSGPGYRTVPNLRLFTGLVHLAQHTLSLTSPYFVPDESLLEAITTAAYRGVAVELFVCEEADQFVVGHAQASYYTVLLEAGVRIYLYPKPAVLHAKHFTVDDTVGVIGSSNMDYRSFGLDYEISLMSTGRRFVEDLQTVAAEYRQLSRELLLPEWRARPRSERYVENVSSLVSALQ